ncbi:MAG: rhomboid family intramembrane serine protease [Myxococcota bacterium]
MSRRPSPWRVVRRFPGTLGIAALTLATFALEHALGGGLDLRAHVRIGALRTDRLAEHWEVWRLVMPMFLHYGAVHLLLNGLAFLQLGPIVEGLWGTRRLVTFYVASGVVATLFSAASNPEGSVAVGASGALMGLAGLLLGTSLYGEESARAFLVQLLGQRLLRAVLLTLAIGVGLWFVLPIVDNWAHIGGLVTGLVLALAYPDPVDRSEPEDTLGAAVAVAVVAAAFAASAAFGGAAMPTMALDTARQLSSRASRNPGRLAAVQSLVPMLEWYDEAGATAEGDERFARAVDKFRDPILLQMLASDLFADEAEGRHRDLALARVLERWIALQPDRPEALNALAWLLVTRDDDDGAQRDPVRAEALAREAIARVPAEGGGGGCLGAAASADGMRAQLLDTLGEALFLQGRYDEALEVQRQSVALARELQLDVLDELEGRLHKIEEARAAG